MVRPLTADSLKRHEVTLERSLQDLESGGNFDHLSKGEIVDLRERLEQRLAGVRAEIEKQNA
jgi:hypothetical protein